MLNLQITQGEGRGAHLLLVSKYDVSFQRGGLSKYDLAFQSVARSPYSLNYRGGLKLIAISQLL
jgi:hypothetical protein